MTELRRKSGVADYDIINQNFDQYFYNLLSGATEQQRASVDISLARKVFKGKTLRVDKLKFTEKAYILGTVFNRPLFVLIGNEGESQDALSLDLFLKAKAALKGKAGAMGELAEEVVETDTFVIASKDLFDTVAMMSLVCTTDIYRLVLPLAKRKLKLRDNSSEFDTAFKFLIKFLSWYEGNKRRFDTDYGLTVSEWYALLYFYDKEKLGSSFYKDAFLNAVQANRTTKKKALTRLSQEGFLFSRGRTNKKMYSLAPKGRDVLLKIFDRVIFNF